MHNSKKYNYKTIRVYKSSFELMDIFCKQYSLTKTELVEAFLNYFDKTKIDPREISDVSTEVKKLKNQLISFIRKQEKDKLDPLVKKQDILIKDAIEFYKNTNLQNQKIENSLTKSTLKLSSNQKLLNDEIINSNKKLVKNQIIIDNKLNKILNAR